MKNFLIDSMTIQYTTWVKHAESPAAHYDNLNVYSTQAVITLSSTKYISVLNRVKHTNMR